LTGKPTITSGGELRIGERFHLASRPIPSHIAVSPGAVLHIGNNVSIGCGAAIAAAESITIGDGTRIGPFAIIMDTNFHGSPGDQSIQHDTRPVTIGAGCVIGTRVTITRGATIGDGAEILAGSVVSSAIPPGVCAAGARARIIGRAGELTSRWDSAAAALPDLLMEALELESPPNLDSSPISGHLRADAQLHSLLAAIESRFGVRLHGDCVSGMQSFAELAAAVEQALAVSPYQAAAATFSLK
jgi:maltose O-acetyltransferase